MTVTYADASFKRLLFKWRGSIWKSVWKELVVFLAMYFAINLTYRFAMPASTQTTFKGVVHFVGEWIKFIPLQFLLGFFVQFIVGRWWDQLMNIAWPDKFLLFLTANLPGNDYETKVTRRTIARWVLLHAALVWKEISMKIKKRFPTDEHLLKAGLFTESEWELYNNTTSTHGRWFVPISWIVNLLVKKVKDDKLTPRGLNNSTSTHGRWFVPVSWIVNLLAKKVNEGKLSQYGQNLLTSELYAFRGASGMLTIYDWINAPLRYTQVATFATYGYFTMCLIGRQAIAKQIADVNMDGFDETIDMYFPVVTVLEFIFYVGWLKVAEEYRVPFGEDDDDFDMNYILDRNVHVANMLVDELAAHNPEECEDRYFHDRNPVLPHTKASAAIKDQVPSWRLCQYRVPEDASQYLDQSMKAHNVEIPDNDTLKKPLLATEPTTRDDLHIGTSSKRNSIEDCEVTDARNIPLQSFASQTS